MTRANTLTEIWNTYNNNVLSENAPAMKAAKFGTKPGKGGKNLNDADAGDLANKDTSGPENADIGETAHPYSNVIDPKHNNAKDELYDSEIYSSEKYNENDKKIEKKVKESINNYMKSTFDKLFENVMGEEMHSDQETQELDALGIETDAEEAGDGDVTITLDRDMAKQLCDLLQAAMGEDGDDDAEAEDGEYGHGEMEEMEEDEDEDAESEEDELEEAIEADDLGHTLVNAKETGLTNAGNNKVGTVKPKGGSASGSTKKYVEAEPKPLADGKAKLQGKDNKVGSLKVGATYGA